MGADYSNDIYYNLQNNISNQAERINWDIGFRTFIRSSSIIINSGAGIKLYEVSTDTNDWYLPVDTTGMNSWTALNNSLVDWEIGAFNANMTFHPDYGWATYNSITHDLIGKAVFLIRLQDGSLKKFFIRRRCLPS